MARNSTARGGKSMRWFVLALLLAPAVPAAGQEEHLQEICRRYRVEAEALLKPVTLVPAGLPVRLHVRGFLNQRRIGWALTRSGEFFVPEDPASRTRVKASSVDGLQQVLSRAYIAPEEVECMDGISFILTYTDGSILAFIVPEDGGSPWYVISGDRAYTVAPSAGAARLLEIVREINPYLAGSEEFRRSFGPALKPETAGSCRSGKGRAILEQRPFRGGDSAGAASFEEAACREILSRQETIISFQSAGYSFSIDSLNIYDSCDCGRHRLHGHAVLWKEARPDLRLSVPFDIDASGTCSFAVPGDEVLSGLRKLEAHPFVRETLESLPGRTLDCYFCECDDFTRSSGNYIVPDVSSDISAVTRQLSVRSVLERSLGKLGRGISIGVSGDATSSPEPSSYPNRYLMTYTYFPGRGITALCSLRTGFPVDGALSRRLQKTLARDDSFWAASMSDLKSVCVEGPAGVYYYLHELDGSRRAKLQQRLSALQEKYPADRLRFKDVFLVSHKVVYADASGRLLGVPVAAPAPGKAKPKKKRR